MTNKVVDDDFGFTHVNEDEIAPVVDTKNKVDRILAEIMPFLDNLKKNPEKDLIKWPNRVEKIDQFKKKLLDISKI